MGVFSYHPARACPPERNMSWARKGAAQSSNVRQDWGAPCRWAGCRTLEAPPPPKEAPPHPLLLLKSLEGLPAGWLKQHGLPALAPPRLTHSFSGAQAMLTQLSLASCSPCQAVTHVSSGLGKNSRGVCNTTCPKSLSK